MLFRTNKMYLVGIIEMAQKLLDEVADEESLECIAEAYDALECVIEEGSNVDAASEWRHYV